MSGDENEVELLPLLADEPQQPLEARLQMDDEGDSFSSFVRSTFGPTAARADPSQTEKLVHVYDALGSILGSITIEEADSDNVILVAYPGDRAERVQVSPAVWNRVMSSLASIACTAMPMPPSIDAHAMPENRIAVHVFFLQHFGETSEIVACSGNDLERRINVMDRNRQSLGCLLLKSDEVEIWTQEGMSREVSTDPVILEFLHKACGNDNASDQSLPWTNTEIYQRPLLLVERPWGGCELIACFGGLLHFVNLSSILKFDFIMLISVEQVVYVPLAGTLQRVVLQKNLFHKVAA